MRHMENNLNNRIVKARKKTVFSQKELAKRLDIAYQTLNKYEKGHRTPDANILRQMANILNCDPGWLLTGEEKPGKNNLTVSESQVIYNVSEDSDLEEILKYLKDNPQDKKLVLKLIKGRKYTKEALEGFNIQNNLNEEGI